MFDKYANIPITSGLNAASIIFLIVSLIVIIAPLIIIRKKTQAGFKYFFYGLFVYYIVNQIILPLYYVLMRWIVMELKNSGLKETIEALIVGEQLVFLLTQMIILVAILYFIYKKLILPRNHHTIGEAAFFGLGYGFYIMLSFLLNMIMTIYTVYLANHAKLIPMFESNENTEEVLLTAEGIYETLTQSISSFLSIGIYQFLYFIIYVSLFLSVFYIMTKRLKPMFFALPLASLFVASFMQVFYRYNIIANLTLLTWLNCLASFIAIVANIIILYPLIKEDIVKMLDDKLSGRMQNPPSAIKKNTKTKTTSEKKFPTIKMPD